MKNTIKSCLLALGLGLTMLGSTSCATISRAPTIVKVAVTPVAVARDVADIVLSAPASAINDYADNFYDSGYKIHSRNGFGHYPYIPGSPFYHGYSSMSYSYYDGNNVGNAAPLFGGILRLAGFCFALPDYVVSRSGTPDWKGTSPYKQSDVKWSDHFWLNTTTLWQKQEPIIKKK